MDIDINLVNIDHHVCSNCERPMSFLGIEYGNTGISETYECPECRYKITVHFEITSINYTFYPKEGK
jgi:DNA-directed RNA polymerase subunit RPC12/RpoP